LKAGGSGGLGEPVVICNERSKTLAELERRRKVDRIERT
jgi:hypothetical protein